MTKTSSLRGRPQAMAQPSAQRRSPPLAAPAAPPPAAGSGSAPTSGPPRRTPLPGLRGGPHAPRATLPEDARRGPQASGPAGALSEDVSVAGTPPATPEASAVTATPERMLLARAERSESSSWRFAESAAAHTLGVSPHAVIDIPDPTPHEIIAGALRNRPFEAESLPPGAHRQAELARQQEMELQYIDAMAAVLQTRRSVFGGDGRYDLEQDMKAPYQEAVLPAIYEATRQFISSASRSPARNALIAKIGPHTGPDGESLGELAFQMDASSIAGAAAGVPAYLTDAWLLNALSRRAKLANFPHMAAVQVEALIPDPSPVQLRLVGAGNAKRYWRPALDEPARGAERELPTMNELKSHAASRREAIVRWQKRLDGQGLMRWFQPGMGGAFNVARRALSSTRALVQPLPVFGASVVASSSAGALSKFALTMAKATPRLSQVEVDNLVGGRQTVNLFAVKAPDAGREAAGWSDIRRLPQFVGEVAQEAGALAATSLRPALNNRIAQAVDVLRTSLANATASVVSQAVGPMLGSVMRDGSPSPLASEPLNSHAFLAQQFAQSAMNDYEWNSSKDYMKSDAHDLAAELDAVRDSKQNALLRTLDRTRAEVLGHVRALRESRPLQDGLAGALGTIEDTMQLEGRADTRSMRQAMRSLEQAAGAADLPSASATRCASIVDGMEASMRLASQHEHLVRWRRPAGAAADLDDRRR